jgi:hypothetical protein
MCLLVSILVKSGSYIFLKLCAIFILEIYNGKQKLHSRRRKSQQDTSFTIQLDKPKIIRKGKQNPRTETYKQERRATQLKRAKK